MEICNFGILPQHYTASQPRSWRQNGPLKRWYPTTTLYDVTTQKTYTLILLIFFLLKVEEFFNQ
jgi:hypothetical protein